MKSFNKTVSILLTASVFTASIFAFSGCSETPPAEITDDTVVVDYNAVLSANDNMAFGMVSKSPSPTLSKLLLQECMEIGITWSRDCWVLSEILPKSFISDMDYWNANTNDCRNIDNWYAINHMKVIQNIKDSGQKIMICLTYCPEWLSYTGDFKGVPRDWDIYEAIIKELVAKYGGLADYYEIGNEYDSNDWFDITGSPYSSVREAYTDIYKHAAKAILSVDPDAKIGGPSAKMGGDTSLLEDLLNDPEITPDSNMLSFVTFHEYTDKDITYSVGDYKKLLDEKGFEGIPIYINEWNNSTRDEMYHNTYGVSYVGKTLTYFIKKNVGGAFYDVNVTAGAAYNEDFGIASYDPVTQTMTYSRFTDAFKIASLRCGLGAGDYNVCETRPGNTTSSVGCVNNDGQYILYCVNDTDKDITTPFVLDNMKYSGKPPVKYYMASTAEDASTGINPDNLVYGKGQISGSVNIPAYGVVGIVVNDSFEYVAPITSDFIAPTAPTIVNPGFEDGYEGWMNNGDISTFYPYSGKNCTVVVPGYSAEQVVLGLSPNTIYRLTAWVISPDGITEASLGCKENGFGEMQTTYNGSDYKQISCDFATGPENESAKIYLFNFNGGGNIYGDDFTIDEIGKVDIDHSAPEPTSDPLLPFDSGFFPNGGFEKDPVLDKCPKGFDGGVITVDSPIHSEDYAGQLGHNNAAAQHVDLEPNTAYVFSAWVKHDVSDPLIAAQSARTCLVVKFLTPNSSDDVYYPFEFNGDWHYEEVEFKTRDTAERIYLGVWNAPDCITWVDDIKCVKK